MKEFWNESKLVLLFFAIGILFGLSIMNYISSRRDCECERFSRYDINRDGEVNSLDLLCLRLYLLGDETYFCENR